MRPWPAVALGCAALLVVLGATQSWINDDALITFRYVENLVAGHGLVYNVGEKIEAFSNPLFALLIAPAALAKLDLFLVAKVLGLAAAALEAFLVVRLTARVTDSTVWSALAGLLLATDRVAVVWSTGGLESSLQGALLVAMLSVSVSALDSPRSAVVPGAALSLLVAVGRPEGILFYPVHLVCLLLGGRRADAGISCAIRSINIVVVGLALLVAARWLYYGELLPNPYYAKVDGVPSDGIGLAYAAGFARRLGLLDAHAFTWGALVALAAVTRLPSHRAPLVAGALTVAIGVGAVGFMGGDYMTDFRLMRPLLGPLYFTIAVALASAASRARWRWVGAATLACGAAILASHAWRQTHPTPIVADAPRPADHKRILTIERAKADHFRDALLRFAEPGDSILADWSGFMGYGHTLRTVDATGLVSKSIERDFYLRDAFAETGARERFPGHARWPRIEFMERERFTFVFPKINHRPAEDPEIHAGALPRTRSYPFLHVTVGLGGGEFLRFFTTLTPEEIQARARRRSLTDVCWRKPFGPLACAP